MQPPLDLSGFAGPPRRLSVQDKYCPRKPVPIRSRKKQRKERNRKETSDRTPRWKLSTGAAAGLWNVAPSALKQDYIIACTIAKGNAFLSSLSSFSLKEFTSV